MRIVPLKLQAGKKYVDRAGNIRTVSLNDDHFSNIFPFVVNHLDDDNYYYLTAKGHYHSDILPSDKDLVRPVYEVGEYYLARNGDLVEVTGHDGEGWGMYLLTVDGEGYAGNLWAAYVTPEGLFYADPAREDRKDLMDYAPQDMDGIVKVKLEPINDLKKAEAPVENRSGFKVGDRAVIDIEYHSDKITVHGTIVKAEAHSSAAVFMADADFRGGHDAGMELGNRGWHVSPRMYNLRHESASYLQPKMEEKPDFLNPVEPEDVEIHHTLPEVIPLLLATDRRLDEIDVASIWSTIDALIAQGRIFGPDDITMWLEKLIDARVKLHNS